MNIKTYNRFILLYLYITIIFLLYYFPSKLKEIGAPILNKKIESPEEAKGPLFVNPDNPRYFTDGTQVDGKYKVIYLTGSHNWCNFMDCGDTDPPRQFDYDDYLDFLDTNNHNFFRLWRAENLKGGEALPDFWYSPAPYQRTGPGLALDSKAKFDLTKFNQAYFDRMRSRISEAGAKGIYVSVMLFDGWGIENQISDHDPWLGHPYNKYNNINGVDGDLDGDGQGDETHQLLSPAILELQESYVRKVIDTVNDLDNVLYEISNESKADGNSRTWQYHMVNFIKDYENTKDKQHPIGLTVERFCNHNNELFTSPADWISPCFDINDPVPNDGKKVIVGDTDHPCGICGNRAWVWKSFTRGYNPIYMDRYFGPLTQRGQSRNYDPNNFNDVNIRKNLGYTAQYADRINLVTMKPQPDLCSTGYCLANPVREKAEYLIYLPLGETVANFLKEMGINRNPSIYLPADKTVTVDLTLSPIELSVEWFNPVNGSVIDGGSVLGGGTQKFSAPFNGDAVLYIYSSLSLSPSPTTTKKNNTTYFDPNANKKTPTATLISTTSILPSLTFTFPSLTMTRTPMPSASLQAQTNTMLPVAQISITSTAPLPISTQALPNTPVPCVRGFIILGGFSLFVIVWSKYLIKEV